MSQCLSALIEVVVTVVCPLDAADRVPEASLCDLAAYAERGKVRPCRAPQVVQRERREFVLDARERYVQRVESDMWYALSWISTTLRKDVLAAGCKLFQSAQPLDHRLHERDVEPLARLCARSR